MEISLEGWDIARFDEVDWLPWGGSGASARAKILAVGDGYNLTLVEADAGYVGDPHVHEYPESWYLLEGTVRNQGLEMRPGDGYVAAAGSTHTDFATDTGARYLLVFKI